MAFQYADRLVEEITPAGLNKIFFTQCGSTAVDSALKMCLAYHKSRGNTNRVRFIGRERGYHGVGFGGISVGGILANRHQYATSLLPNVDHLAHTHNLKENAFSKGCPSWGAHLAEDLERLVALHGADTIAAVIVEPVAGSTGVLVPPVGYLQKLRSLCDKHGILLIFDEVITAFGRLGQPTASHFFDITPDVITVAKGMTNACVPAGAVFAKSFIYDTISQNSKPGSIEFFHGYTYSGHPLACAAGLAALDVYKQDKLFENASSLSTKWENSLHSLKDASPHVIDIRNLGLMGAIELKSIEGSVGKRASAAFQMAFDKGLLIRVTGETIALSPPLIVNEQQIDQIVNILGDVLRKVE
jgi:beta-alanine--pyruvate transaminase